MTSLHKHARGASCAGTIAACLALGLAPSVLWAHPEWSPLRVNRYAKLVLAGPESSRLVYTILYGDGPALSGRRGVDLDHDGRVDERERALLGASAASAVRAGLHLFIDGAPLTLSPSAIDVGLAGIGVAPEPYSVDLSYPLPLAAGAHELMIDDRVLVPSEGDTELAIEAAPPTELVAAHRGERGRGRDSSFVFRGPRASLIEDRSLRIELRLRPSSPWRAALRPLSLVTGLVILGLCALWVWRCRRARRSTGGGDPDQRNMNG